MKDVIANNNIQLVKVISDI